MNGQGVFQSASLVLVCCFFLAPVSAGQEQSDIQQLIQRLQSADPLARENAAEELAHSGPEAAAALPTLIVTLQDEIVYVRRSSAYALGKLGAGSAEARTALIRALEDPDYGVQQSVISALAGFGEAVIPELMAVWDRFYIDPQDEFGFDTTAQAAASAAIVRMGAPAVPYVLDALKDALNRADFAQAALARFGSNAVSATPLLVDALDHQEERVRVAAAIALGSIGPPSADLAVPALMRALGDPATDVAVAAARAIAKLGEKSGEAIPALERAAQSPDPLLREAARLALLKIRGE